MRCTTARILLTKQVREPLGSGDELALREHLERCRGCADEAVGFIRQDAALARILAEAPRSANDVAVDTRAILTQGARHHLPRWRPALAAATVLGLILIGAYGWRAREQRAETPGGNPGAPVATPKLPGEPTEPAITSTGGAPSKPAVASGVDPRIQLPSLGTTEGVSVPRTAPSSREAVARRRIPAIALQVIGRMTTEPEPEREQTQLVQAPPRQDAVLQVAFVAPGEPALETGKVDKVFAGDAALAPLLTLKEKDRPLGELLPRLGRQLKTRLSAARSVSDDKVSLFLTKRPAAETLTLIGRHLGFRWRRTTDGYELLQDIAGKQREEALFRNELEPIETQLNLASRLMRLPQKELRARLDELDAKLKTDSLTPAERATMGAEKQIAIDALVASTTVGTSLAMFRALTPAQVDALLGGTELTYSTATGTLAPILAEKIYETTATLESINGPQAKLQADATIRVTDVADQDDVPPPRKDRQLRLECQYNTVRGERGKPLYWGTRWAPTIPDLPDTDAAVTSATTTDPDLKRLVELMLPGPARQPGRWNGGGGVIGAAVLGYVWTRQATLAEVAEAIQHATGLEVVADSFVSARIDPALLRPRQPLIDVLGTLARELDYKWEKKGRLITLRSRRYYRDRPAEAPSRIVNAFRDQVLRENALSLDSLASLCAALPDPQVRSMYRYWGWYLEDTRILPVDSLFPRRAHFRFWNGLSPTQKSAARAGAVLPVAQMLPAQQALWTAALFAPPVSSRTPSPELRGPTPAELSGGGFSLRSYEAQLMSFITPVDDGKRLVGTSISVEGPRSVDPLKFVSTENGGKPEGAGPQVSATGYEFRYFLGGRKEPAVKDNIFIAPPMARAGGK
ncbi:MAG: hypothetical protein ACO1SX_07480, partial [Actinomycetota bacterium]